MKQTFKKRAFISAIAMLIVSAIVLTSSTFAWFSLGKVGTVGPLNLEVTAPDGVQISANAKSWGGSVSLEHLIGSSGTNKDAYTGHWNQVPSLMFPVSGVSATYSLYDGQYPRWHSASVNSDGQLVYGGLLVESAKSTPAAAQADTNRYVAFDIFVNVASATTVKFGGSFLDDPTNNTQASLAVRAGILNCGNFAKGTAVETIVAGKGRTGTFQIYEPNAKAHTDDAYDIISQYPAYYSFNADGTQTVYGITQLFANKSYPFERVVPDGIAEAQTTSKEEITLSLPAGITKFRVYVWIEGQDFDCTNAISGGTLNMNVKFSMV